MPPATGSPGLSKDNRLTSALAIERATSARRLLALWTVNFPDVNEAADSFATVFNL